MLYIATLSIVLLHIQNRRINKNRTSLVIMEINKAGPAYEIV